MFCEDGKLPARCAGQRFCHCTHIVKAKLNSIVELVIIDETRNIGPINHPFHLHGYAMHVSSIFTSIDRFLHAKLKQQVMQTDFIKNVPMTVDLYKKLSRSRMLPDHKRNLDTQKTASLQDTISLPSQGYTVLR